MGVNSKKGRVVYNTFERESRPGRRFSEKKKSTVHVKEGESGERNIKGGVFLGNF